MEKMFLPWLKMGEQGMWGELCINTHSSLYFYVSPLLPHSFPLSLFLQLPHETQETKMIHLHMYTCADVEKETLQW